MVEETIQGGQPAAQDLQPSVESAVNKLNIQSLSTIEKAIYLEFGSDGVSVFRLSSRNMTVNEISKDLALEEEKVIELINKMKGKYLYVEEPKVEKGAEIAEAKPKEIVVIDVPKKTSSDNISSVALISELTIKFGPTAKKIYEMIDGKLDVLQLASMNLVSLDYVDNLMWVLADKKSVSFVRLYEEDIKKKYGSMCFNIFNKYGRDGLFLYQLLDRTSDPVLAIRYSEIEPSMAVEAMDYILKLIGAPIAFNKKDALTSVKR